MPALEADKVVVALEADLGSYSGKVAGGAATFRGAMSDIEKSANRAEGATRNSLVRIGEHSQRAGASQMILQSIVRRTTDQFAAGAPLATIFAEHIAAVAEAGAMAGGKLGKLGTFLGGPWGLILTSAISVLSIFGAKLFEGGESAKHQKDQLEKLTKALDDYQRTSGAAVSNDYVRLRLMELMTQRTAAHTVKIREQIKAQLALALANQQATDNAPGASSAGTPTGMLNDMKVASLQSQLAQAGKDVEEARRNASVASGNRIVADNEANASGADSVAASAAKVKRAQDQYAITLNNLEVGLRKGVGKGGIDQATFDRLQLAALRRMQSVTDDKALTREGDAAQRKAAAAARAAEVQRQKAVRDNDAFQTELNKENDQLIQAKTQLTGDTRAADEEERKRIRADRDSRNRDFASKGPGGTKQFSQAQVDQLTGKSNAVADAQIKLVNRKEQERTDRENLDLTTEDIDAQREILQAHLALATSSKDRQAAALRLLDLSDQLEKAQIDAVLASKLSTETEKQIAQKRLDTLNLTAPERRASVARATQGPLGNYREQLQRDVGDTNDAFQGAAVDGLKQFNDEIDNAASKALHLHGVLGTLVSDLIRIGSEKLILSLLSDGATGGVSGLVGSLFGRASGGSVTGGRMYRVNEGASPGRVEGFMPQGSGKVIPLGQMDAHMGRGGTTIVQQSFHLDARYGVTTPELLEYVNGTAARAATHAGAASFRAGQAATPARLQQLQALGN